MVADPLEDLRSSSTLRKTAETRTARPHLMLDVRLKDGSQLALPYAYLLAIGLELPAGSEPRLVLTFTSHKLQIFGRRLQALYDRLLIHGIGQLRELHRPFDDVPKGEVVLTRIEVELLG